MRHTRHTRLFAPRQAGFSMVELIMVIVVIGIIAGIVAVFISNPIQSYLATSRRAEMVDIADTALLRIARDVRAALPNSLRVTTSGGNAYIEFLPIQEGGRYRAEPSGDILDFTDGNDAAFDVLGPTVSATTGQYLVIYNLGLDASSDAWQGGNRRTVSANGTSSVSFTATGTPFPLESPSRRFFLTGTPVSFECNPTAHTVRRYWGYTLTAAQPTTFSTGSNALLASRVKACSFVYDAGASQRLGQLTLWLQLENTEGGSAESVSLYLEIAVNNEA